MEVEYILILAGAMAATFIAAGIYFTARTRRKVAYMLDALEDKETNFRFSEDRGMERKFNRTLNRIRTIFEKERNEIREQEQYYGKMLDHVQTGIVVVDEDGERINYCNAMALRILGMATFSNIKQLKRISESLDVAFRKVAEGAEEKASYFNESSRVTISITASEAEIRGKNVKIVAFNDISSDIEENESASWTRLIRVLTHEIMNTVTPIASLSDALVKYAESDASEEVKTDSHAPDIKAGLQTIATSANGLIKFVESYRNLTHIAAPVRKAFFLRELIDTIRKLTAGQFAGAGASFLYEEKDEDILLYADFGQISQILVNLVRNALQAGASEVRITAWIDSMESVVVDIANNGQPISKESREEIFVPFFTTKPSGTGIGLSISRQIMRLHNGTLRLSRSDPGQTVFTLVFR